MVRPDPGALRDFVRHTLGCGCPEDVLQSITQDSIPAAAGGGSVMRIDVGGRLLVHILSVSEGDEIDAVAAVLAAGVEDRDRGGYNRYRLVLVARGRAAFHAAAAAAAAAAASERAERVHVHVVPREQAPFV